MVWRQDGFGPAPWHRLGCQLLQGSLGLQQPKHLLSRHIGRKLVTALFVTGEDGGPYHDDDGSSQGRHAAVMAPSLGDWLVRARQGANRRNLVRQIAMDDVLGQIDGGLVARARIGRQLQGEYKTSPAMSA